MPFDRGPPLEPAPSLRGQVPDWTRAFDTVRRVALSIDGRGGRSSERAPFIDNWSLRQGTKFELRTMGAGTYEVRLARGVQEVRVGPCRVDDDVRMVTFDAPASLSVELLDPEATRAPPVLLRQRESSGWALGVAYDTCEIVGTLRESKVLFDTLSPATYALVPPPQTHIDPASFARTGPILTLAPGAHTRIEWSSHEEARTLQICVDLPAGIPASSLSLAFVPLSQAPVFLPNLAWTSLEATGRTHLSTLHGEVGLLVAPETSGADGSTALGNAVPLGVVTLSANDDAVDVRIPAPAQVAVGANEGQRIVLIHDLLAQVLGYYPRILPDEPSPPLLPGRWQIEWYPAYGGPRVHAKDVVLAPFEVRHIEAPR